MDDTQTQKSEENNETTDEINQEAQGSSASEEQTEEAHSQNGDENTVNYAQKLEEERAARQKAEKKLNQAEYNIENLKKERKQQEQEKNQIDSGEIESVRQELDNKFNEMQRSMLQDQIDSEIDTVSSDEKEAELIRHMYENTLQPNGYDRRSIRKDIQRAKLLANEDRYVQENQALKDSLASEKTKYRAAAQSGEKVENEVSVSLSPEEEAIAERMYRRGSVNSLQEARRKISDSKNS